MFRSLIVVFALVPGLANAVSDQLLRSIEIGLREYRIETNVSALTTAQAAALHLELTSPENDRIIHTDQRARQTILQILRRNPATNPDLR